MNKQALIVDIRGQIQHLPFSRYFKTFQRELDRLGPLALMDLRDLLEDVERMRSGWAGRKSDMVCDHKGCILRPGHIPGHTDR